MSARAQAPSVLPSAAPAASSPASLVGSLLAEIAAHLSALAQNGREAAIDLLGLPMGEAERDALARALGRGEVEARLSVGGESEIWETAYAGVWWVRHFGAGGELTGERIEITSFPAILAAAPADIAAAAQRLGTRLVSPPTPALPAALPPVPTSHPGSHPASHGEPDA